MAFADTDYYTNTYGGTVIPTEDLDRELERASDDIDSLTYNRIQAIGFEFLTLFQQGQIKKAVCAQAEFRYQYAEFTDLPLDSFSAGSISISLGDVVNGIVASKQAKRLLDQTGLTSRRV